ncbi:TolB family protein [Arthrobacter sp. ATA002]|uniref:TolB family protein n=1 Tax=Arthrobacter sp. ATA002 TaxID=2991715 RepID=UPI002E35B308|nr:hypothetical protein [Arthrobacter sp. ATA002]
MKPCDLNLLQSVSAPTIHPDGTHAVVSVTRPDFAADAYVGQLWTVPLAGAAAPRRLTRGFADTQPRFSPDGTVLGFLRSMPGGKPQLYAVPAAGGEPVQLTDRKMGVGAFNFSPDSAQLVFSSRIPQHGRYGTVDGVGPGAEDPRLISTYKYRVNGAGYTADKRTQLFLLDLPALDAEPWIAPAGRAGEHTGTEPVSRGRFPEARQLTHADADAAAPVFSANGKQILFTAALHQGADEDLVSDVYSVSLTGSAAPERLTNTGNREDMLLAASEPTPSADGNLLYFLGQELSASGTDFVARNTALYVLPADAAGTARRLTDPESIDLAEGGIVAGEGSAVLVFNRTRGSVELLQVDADGARQTLVPGPRVVQGAAAAGGAVVVSYADAATVGEIAAVDDGGLRRLTDFSGRLRAETRVAPVLEETHPSRTNIRCTAGSSSRRVPARTRCC